MKIKEDVKDYYEKRIVESSIKMVPGHYPVLTTKEEVDLFFNRYLARILPSSIGGEMNCKR